MLERRPSWITTRGLRHNRRGPWDGKGAIWDTNSCGKGGNNGTWQGRIQRKTTNYCNLSFARIATDITDHVSPSCYKTTTFAMMPIDTSNHTQYTSLSKYRLVFTTLPHRLNKIGCPGVPLQFISQSLASGINLFTKSMFKLRICVIENCHIVEKEWG